MAQSDQSDRSDLEIDSPAKKPFDPSPKANLCSSWPRVFQKRLGKLGTPDHHLVKPFFDDLGIAHERAGPRAGHAFPVRCGIDGSAQRATLEVQRHAPELQISAVSVSIFEPLAHVHFTFVSVFGARLRTLFQPRIVEIRLISQGQIWRFARIEGVGIEPKPLGRSAPSISSNALGAAAFPKLGSVEGWKGGSERLRTSSPITYHASRITHHASRITNHASQVLASDGAALTL